MTNLFAAKLLSQLQAKKKEGGFTLIELLVVVIIIGVLSAVALPQFLNQAARARQVEGETTLGAINRAQQTHRLQRPTFGTIQDLEGSGSISLEWVADAANGGAPTSIGQYYTFVATPGNANAAAPNDANTVAGISTAAPRDGTGANDAEPQGLVNYATDLRQYQSAYFQNPNNGAFSSLICRSGNPAANGGDTVEAVADPVATAAGTNCTDGVVVN